MRVLKFLGAGLVTALIDNGVFIAMHRATGIRFLSLAIATFVSVTFNYLVVRAFVFEESAHASTVPKYLGVHGVGLLARWGILEGIIAAFHLQHGGIYAAKLIADGIVYSLKYVAQRDFVFTSASRSAAPESDPPGWLSAPESIQPDPRPSPESRS